jgi:hypothetical protein
MPRSTSLIDLHLSGKSAKIVIDEVLAELPPLPSIRQSILNELPRGSRVRVDEKNMVFYVDCSDRRSMVETITLYERIYPEVEFAPETRGKDQ